MPAAFTVAMAVLALLQVPPLTLSVSVVVAVGQTVVAPLIAPALAGLLTVTFWVVVAVPQLFVTV